ncbi:MAG: Gfo/Idh/MocA family oxidoreductase [Gemmataceae bacterium]|nr:Gfo/Idh/MocA family oxidoreductase [Gemmata sp.]MDW8199203.1 Gfo/Idh/MocA family oxidoreductase [Gemmataceae bacterium]
MANRRDFLKTTAAVSGVAIANNLSVAAYAGGGNDVIKVGLIGCGGRGMGAVRDILEAEKRINGDNPKVEIIAVADVFKNKAENAAKTLTNPKSDRYGPFFKQIKVTPETTFDGLDAYEKLLKTDVNLVILATPPGFRPQHLEAAVRAGKHIFCEKPVAVDATGARKCYSLIDESKKKGLAIVAGTQRRHQKPYIEIMKKIHDGAIGEIRAARCSWNGREPWFRKREEGMADSTYQIHNWYHFLWTCGDHIVEQHVHNIDVINWALNDHPIRATGFGGRSFRHPGPPKEAGHIWDHFAVEFEYKNGMKMFSYCRHFPVGGDDVSEMVIGSTGVAYTRDGSAYQINGKPAVADDRGISAYVQEHIDLLNSIRAGAPLNELKNVTDSTFTAILGRNACYSGMALKWDDALASAEDWMPKNLALGQPLEVSRTPLPGSWKLPPRA